MTRQEKWDRRFLEMATLISSWSKDPSTKVGAVIVRPNLTICSVGFNGFPKQMTDNHVCLTNRELKLARTVHAEINAQIHAREPITGYTLYTTIPCCNPCSIQLIQCGIIRCVSGKPTPEIEARWGESWKQTFANYYEAGVEHVEY